MSRATTGPGGARPGIFLSSTAAAAAEALATRTVGALVKIGSNGLPADASVTDAQLAADNAKVATLATGGFYDSFALLASTYAPGAGKIRGIDLWAGGPLPSGVSAAVDAGMEGGGIIIPTGGWKALSGYILQTPKTQPWAVQFDAVIPVPTAGLVGYLALGSASKADYIGLAHFGAYDATKLVLDIMLNNADETAKATSWVLDNARHTFTLAYNGSTTITVLVDGSVVTTQTTLTNVPTGPLQLASISSSADSPNQVKVARIATATVL